MRYATIGHKPYFMNHYVENSNEHPDFAGFDYDHYNLNFLHEVMLFNPDVTLIYRPEMFTTKSLLVIPGIKIGFSTEPLPKYLNGTLIKTNETHIREPNYLNLKAEYFDSIYHYDIESKSYIDEIGLKFSGYRSIPINTEWFNPLHKKEKQWDVLFIGKATERRNKILDFLRMDPRISFLWVAHGVFGNELADLIKKSRCVINVHADDSINLEPRIYLAAACGTPVLSEPVGSFDFPFSNNIFYTSFGFIDYSILIQAIESWRDIHQNARDNWTINQSLLSVKEFMTREFVRLKSGKIFCSKQNKVKQLKRSKLSRYFPSSSDDNNAVCIVSNGTYCYSKSNRIPESCDITFVVPNLNWGSAKYRAIFPAISLSENGLDICVIQQDQCIETFFKIAKITKQVIFHRCFNENSMQMLKICKSKNINIYGDIDDLELPDYLHTMPEFSNFDEDTKKHYQQRCVNYLKIFSEADSIFVSTPVLKNVILELCDKETIVFKNKIPSIFHNLIHSRHYNSNIFRILFMSGSFTHNIDILSITYELTDFLTQNRDSELNILGIVNVPNSLAQLPNVKVLPFVDYFDIFDVISRNDLCIVPLVPCAFNNAKSNIKYIESGLVEVPVIAYNSAEFQSTITNGQNGFLYNEPKEFLSLLHTLFNHRHLCKKAGKKAKTDIISKYTRFKNSNDDYLDFFTQRRHDFGYERLYSVSPE